MAEKGLPASTVLYMTSIFQNRKTACAPKALLLFCRILIMIVHVPSHWLSGQQKKKKKKTLIRLEGCSGFSVVAARQAGRKPGQSLHRFVRMPYRLDGCPD